MPIYGVLCQACRMGLLWVGGGKLFSSYMHYCEHSEPLTMKRRQRFPPSACARVCVCPSLSVRLTSPYLYTHNTLIPKYGWVGGVQYSIDIYGILGRKTTYYRAMAIFLPEDVLVKKSIIKIRRYRLYLEADCRKYCSCWIACTEQHHITVSQCIQHCICLVLRPAEQEAR